MIGCLLSDVWCGEWKNKDIKDLTKGFCVLEIIAEYNWLAIFFCWLCVVIWNSFFTRYDIPWYMHNSVTESLEVKPIFVVYITTIRYSYNSSDTSDTGLDIRAVHWHHQCFAKI